MQCLRLKTAEDNALQRLKGQLQLAAASQQTSSKSLGNLVASLLAAIFEVEAVS